MQGIERFTYHNNYTGLTIEGYFWSFGNVHYTKGLGSKNNVELWLMQKKSGKDGRRSSRLPSSTSGRLNTTMLGCC